MHQGSDGDGGALLVVFNPVHCNILNRHGAPPCTKHHGGEPSIMVLLVKVVLEETNLVKIFPVNLHVVQSTNFNSNWFKTA